MTIENCQYSVKVKGTSIGSYVLRTQKLTEGIFLESKLMLQGKLGKQTITQQSCLHIKSLHSLSFNEETLSRYQRSSWKVDFDQKSGLVKVARNKTDKANMPYMLPYQDPLGLLYQIRRLKDVSYLQVPMLGKSVLVNRTRTGKLTTHLGEHETKVYILYPGGSYVYVDAKPPHYILRLTQKLRHYFVDSLLIKTTEEKGSLNKNKGKSKSKNKLPTQQASQVAKSDLGKQSQPKKRRQPSKNPRRRSNHNKAKS